MQTVISTKKELANLYEVHPATMRRWLKDLGVCGKHRITPKILKFVFEELGMPDEKIKRG